MNENTIWITNDYGEEFEMKILCTFESDATGKVKKYVILESPDEEDTYLAYEYTDEGDLNEISDEEMEMCQEVLDTIDEEFL